MATARALVGVSVLHAPAQFLFNFVLFFYGLYNGVSGTSMFDTWTTLSFSVIYTFCPVLAVGARSP